MRIYSINISFSLEVITKVKRSAVILSREVMTLAY